MVVYVLLIKALVITQKNEHECHLKINDRRRIFTIFETSVVFRSDSVKESFDAHREEQQLHDP